MKPKLCFLLLLTQCFSMAAMAYDAKIDGIYYNFSGTEATVTFQRGESGTYFSDYSGDIVIPQSITYNDVTYQVTRIGNYAFYQCHELTSVIVPVGVTSIGTCAFYRCSNLISINIPEGLTNISFLAFCDCIGISSITIPESTSLIQDNAFEGCSGLFSIKVEEGNPVYDSRNNCNAIIESASNALILGCINTIIPKSVKTIGYTAFSKCSNLYSIIIPESVSAIVGEAFYNCSNLASISIPCSVIDISGHAFAGCTSLASISVDECNPKYDSRDNCNAIIETNTNTLIVGCSATLIPDDVVNIAYEAFRGRKGIASITIPNGVTSIEGSAFCGVHELTSVTIPSSVTSIGQTAFGWCPSLTSILIPNGVSNINHYMFEECGSLSSVTIGNVVTNIGDRAFSGCRSLSSFKTYTATPPIVTPSTFQRSNYYEATLYVPGGSKEAYEAADYWKNFKEIIELHSISVDGISILSAESNTIVIDLANEASNLVAFQMDLTLPEGIGINKEGCSLSSRITDEEQELKIGKLENGAYRLTSSSLSLTPISGQEGTLLTLELTAENGSIGGQATISNIIFSTSESEKIVMSDETFDVNVLYKVVYKVGDEIYQTDEFAYNTQPTIADEPTREGYTFGGWSELPELMPNHDVEITGRFYLFGDVNTDEGVDVVDVVDIARFVVATPSTQFHEKLADLNRDNTVNLGDAVVLINHIAGDQNFVKARFAPAWSVERNDVLSLTQSSNSLALNLSNSRGYTAFQFDLYVSNDAIVNQMMLSSERRQGHQLLYNKLETGHYRVAVLSTSNSTFQGDEGELLSFAVEGAPFEEASIRNILFFDTHANGYAFDDMSIDMATGLQDVNINGNKDDVIYDLQGRKLPIVQRGVNIINGKKVVVK